MKEKIFMYLFIFAAMYAIFQFVNSKRYSEAKEHEIEELHEHIESLETKVEKSEKNKNTDNKAKKQRDFSLEEYSYAREYFEDQNMDADSIAAEVENKIIAQNSAEEDHPLVSYSGFGNQTMKVNRIKILNNRWIIAEYTDGNYWGNSLISYFLNDDDELEFDVLDGVIYND